MGVFLLLYDIEPQKNPQKAGNSMALSDVKVKAATVPDDKKQVKISDAGGLYLLVKPAGKYWKMKYSRRSAPLILISGINLEIPFSH